MPENKNHASSGLRRNLLGLRRGPDALVGRAEDAPLAVIGRGVMTVA